MKFPRPLNLIPAALPLWGAAGWFPRLKPLATAAGLEILSKGGNAADAAVATAAVLNVTEPTSTGLGGDMFALFYDSITGTVTALNGSGRAPIGLTIDRLKQEGLQGAATLSSLYGNGSRGVRRVVRLD